MIEVIAHYKKWKIWARLVFLALIVLSIVAISIWMFEPADTSRHFYFAERSGIVLSWFLAIPLIHEIVAIFRQLVFHDGRLIWIEGGAIIWKRPSSFSVPRKEIIKVTGGFGERPRFDTIIFQLRDGSEKAIETDSLDEPCDEVVRRLKRSLNLG